MQYHSLKLCLSVSTFLTHKKKLHEQLENIRQETGAQAPLGNSNKPKESRTDVSQLPMELTPAQSLSPPPPPQPAVTTTASTEFHLDGLLLTGEVLLVSGRNESLKLPRGFWEEDLAGFMPQIRCQIEPNFDW